MPSSIVCFEGRDVRRGRKKSFETGSLSQASQATCTGEPLSSRTPYDLAPCKSALRAVWRRGLRSIFVVTQKGGMLGIEFRTPWTENNDIKTPVQVVKFAEKNQLS